jgi:hypothetical protein
LILIRPLPGAAALGSSCCGRRTLGVEVGAGVVVGDDKVSSSRSCVLADRDTDDWVTSRWARLDPHSAAVGRGLRRGHPAVSLSSGTTT